MSEMGDRLPIPPVPDPPPKPPLSPEMVGNGNRKTGLKYLGPRQEYIYSPERPTVEMLAEKWKANQTYLRKKSANEDWPGLRRQHWSEFERRYIGEMVKRVAKIQADAIARRMKHAQYVEMRAMEWIAKRDSSGGFLLNPRHWKDAVDALFQSLSSQRHETGDAATLFMRLCEAIGAMVNEKLECPKCKAAFFEGMSEMRRIAEIHEEALKSAPQEVSESAQNP